MRRLFISLSVVYVVALGVSPPAGAQDYLGPNKCVNCHDHEDEQEWWETEDGPPPDGHINALRQMENVDSPTYAGAVGLDASLDGVYDLNGSCVTCHATVFKGDANAGVSCESCHGAGSDYFDSHQEENSYQDSLTKGMLDVIGSVQGWVEQCVVCHIMDDQRLIDAGHPSGDDFVVAEKFDVVVLHWDNDYDVPDVATIAAAVRAEILATRADAAPSEPEPDPEPESEPEPDPVAPADPPAPVRPTLPVNDAPPEPEERTPAPATAAPAPPPPPPPPPPAPPAGNEGGRQVANPPGGALVVPPTPELPRSPAALVAAIQGRAVALLDRLLRRDGRAPVRVTPPEPVADYRGADAELLRLQQEVLALALEALGTAPPSDSDFDSEEDTR